MAIEGFVPKAQKQRPKAKRVHINTHQKGSGSVRSLPFLDLKYSVIKQADKALQVAFQPLAQAIKLSDFLHFPLSMSLDQTKHSGALDQLKASSREKQRG